jgi:outer membrane lipoprotein-sorting protein
MKENNGKRAAQRRCDPLMAAGAENRCTFRLLHTRSHLRRLILLLLCVLLLGMAPGNEAARPVTDEIKMAFLRTWSDHLRSMRTLHMVFTQEKRLRILRRPLIAQGELWLKGEVLFYVLKNTAGDTELELRMDPHAVKTHYPQLHTLEVIDLQTTQSLPLSMPFLGSDPAALTRDYESELFLARDLYTLVFIPRDPKSPLAEIRLTLKDFQPQEFVQVEKNGNRVAMKISDFILNPEVSEAQLKLHIPEGTKVVYPLQ